MNAKLAILFEGDVSPLIAAVAKGKGGVTELAGEIQKLAKSTSQTDLAKSSGIAQAIQQQKHALADMRGTYDKVTAAAIDFKAKGAPNNLIAQYVALRREVERTTQAERQAAMEAAKREAANEAYAASQSRLEAQRRSAIAQNAVASSAQQARGGGGNAMLMPMMMNSLAVGFQDSVSAYQVTGNALSAISAAGNNIIFLLTLMNPMAGAIGAITIGLTQLGVAWLQSGGDAEQSAEQQQEAAKKIEEAFKGMAERRGKAARGDVKGVDDEVNQLQQDLQDKEIEIDLLTKQRDAEVEKTGDRRDQNKLDQLDKVRDKALDDQQKLKNQLADAKDVQSKFTSDQRRVANAAAGKFDKPLGDLQKLKDETNVLSGKETELQQTIRQLRKNGMSQRYIDDYTKAFNENKTAKDAAEAKKKTDRENQIAADKQKREDEQAEENRQTEARKIKDKVRTPWEKARDEEMKNYNLFQEGRLTQGELVKANAAVRKERDDELKRDMPDRVSHAQTLVRGSVEAARVAQTGRTDEKMMEIARQQLTEQRRIATNTGRTNTLAKPKTMGRV